MSEYTNNDVQIVNPGESVIFTESPVPCQRGLVRHREGTGSFLLSGWVPSRYGCKCGKKSALYLVDFGANISIPEGGTVGPISVALAIDGTTVPASSMVVTPSAANEYFNISRAINVEVWNGCCETLTIRNTSAQPIQIQNSNVIITRPDLAITY